ncbi:MAG: acyltransferase family protein [Eggerthellaceae bacterium]|nr:acyltransferase family protein [Eggerthellaceae bacterium]
MADQPGTIPTAASAAKPKRWAFMDVLNVVAIFAVILLHVSLNIFDLQKDTAWNVALVYQCVAIFAVPIFFMVSGANLLGYRERYDTPTFFRKRALRVVLTLIIWSAVIYLLVCFCSGLFGFEPRRFGLVEFAKELLTDNVISIYWFFYVIIGLYLVTPIFSLIAANRRVLEYTLVLAALMCFVVPAVNAFAPIHYVTDPLALRFFTWSLTYYLLGFYLVRYVTWRPPVWALILACVASVAVMLGATWALNAGTEVGGTYRNLFAAAEGLPTLVYAPALFMLFKRGEEKIAASKAYPVWRTLAGLSLKVYAIHLVFVWIFDAQVLSGFAANSGAALAMQFIVEPLVVYAVSLAVAWVLEKAKTALKARLRRS